MEIPADDFNLFPTTMFISVKGHQFRSSFNELEDSLNFSMVISNQVSPIIFHIEAKNIDYPSEKSEFRELDSIIDLNYNINEQFRTPSKKKTKKKQNIPAISFQLNFQRKGEK